LKEKTSEFKLTTPFSKIICSDECDFWIISDKEKGDYYYNKNGYGFISNSSTIEAVKLITDSTFTSLIDSKIEIYETTSVENQYLESLLIDAGENQRENEKLRSKINLSKKSDEFNSNILEIKLKNNLNIERTIYLTYTK
jgi:hypothetical protein